MSQNINDVSFNEISTQCKNIANELQELQLKTMSKEEFDKKNDDFAKKYETLNQTVITKSKISEEALQIAKDCEAKLCQPNFTSAEAKNNAIVEYKKHLNNFLRNLTPVQQDVKAAFYNQLVDNIGCVLGNDVKKSLINDLESQESQGLILIPEMKTLSTDSNPNGGYLTAMPDKYSQRIERIFETSPMRNVASVLTINSDSMEFDLDDDEASTGGWVAESGNRDIDTGTPQIARVKIELHEQFAQPKITQKMLDESLIDIESWLQRKITNKFQRVENTAFISGTGVGQPKGILSYDPWTSAGVYERNKIEQINSGSLGALTADGIKDLVGSLLEEYQPNAVFMMKRNTFTQLTKLTDNQGRYLLDWESLKNGDTKVLEGKSVIFANDMQEVSNNSLSVAYGDFGQAYFVLDKLGVRVIRDPYTTKGSVKYYATKRTGGGVANFEAIKLQKLSV